ncbi:MAG: prolyl oligopeptidase family serine peptidase [Anaerolineales bacterium]|nr:prolyl oligopeptidase family serine peptidase [Chloroflexota bacterium]MBL7161857.1 prolyl oligopeptidase family serine peptidase [Anaerolineales bacterium]
MKTFAAISIPIPLLIMTASCITPQYEPVPPGIYEIELDPSHRYTLSIPEDYSGEKPVPLVVALHYGGHGTPFYGKSILTDMVEPALRELGAVIISPDCPSSDWTQPESEVFVIEILDTIQAKHNIDSDKVLVTGYSLGGMGTWHFAASQPDRFSAGVVMAGMPPGNALEIEWAVPLYVIHGRDDEVLPIDPTLSAVAQLQSQGVDIKLKILEGVTHYETYLFVEQLKDTIPWITDSWK